MDLEAVGVNTILYTRMKFLELIKCRNKNWANVTPL